MCIRDSGGIVLHAVAILGDELHTGRQVLEVVDAHTVKVLGDGDGLVHIAQAYFGSLLLHPERCLLYTSRCV